MSFQHLEPMGFLPSIGTQSGPNSIKTHVFEIRNMFNLHLCARCLIRLFWFFATGWCRQSDRHSRFDQLHPQWRMDSSRESRFSAPRQILHQYSRTLPGNRHHLSNPPQNSVLHVQHCFSLHDDVDFDRFSLLPAPRFWRKNCTGSDSLIGLFRFHVGYRRKDARNFRIHSTYW